MAGYDLMRAQLQYLREQIEKRRGSHRLDVDVDMHRLQSNQVLGEQTKINVVDDLIKFWELRPKTTIKCAKKTFSRKKNKSRLRQFFNNFSFRSLAGLLTFYSFLQKDFTEVPLCESTISCDNLVCDAHGKPPNPSIVVQVRMSQSGGWIKYGRTEVIEVRLDKL